VQTAAHMLRSRRAIIFDLFHTLLSLEQSAPGWTPTHQLLGLSREEWNEALFRNTRGRLLGTIRDPEAIVADIAHRIDPSIPPERIRAAAAQRAARFAVAFRNVPEATLQVLRALKDQGKRLCLCSNADAMESAGWSDSPLAPLFDAAVFSCNEGCLKPEPQIYDLCLRRLGVAPAEALYVGDGGSRELEGARAAGLTTIMVLEHIRALWPELIPDRLPHADFVIEHLAELAADSE
jgi:putative hydrolase of the HAD superfamily